MIRQQGEETEGAMIFKEVQCKERESPEMKTGRDK